MAKSPDIPRQTNLIEMIGASRKPVTQTDDGWIKVGDSTDEISPPFQNSWISAIGGAPLSFFLDTNGVVRFRGDVTGGTPGTVVFTLPVGFRPEFTMQFTGVGIVGEGNSVGRIMVEPNGDVTILSLSDADETPSPGSDGFWKTVSGVLTRATTIAWSELTSIPSTFAPSAHKNTHKTGGSDAFVVTDLLDAIARVGVRKNSAGSTFNRRRVNLIEGSNITITVADDSGDEEVDVTIASSGGGGGSGIGSSALVYRYTVTGTDKASIDTGVDTLDAGSNDWTNGDLLEVYLTVRSDQAARLSDCLVRFNNDSGSLYTWMKTRNSNGSLSASFVPDSTSIDLFIAGASAPASVFSGYHMTLPNYAGTVAFKTFQAKGGTGDHDSGNGDADLYDGSYYSTSAITRLAISLNSTFKFKVGTQLLIYKRLAS